MKASRFIQKNYASELTSFDNELDMLIDGLKNNSDPYSENQVMMPGIGDLNNLTNSIGASSQVRSSIGNRLNKHIFTEGEDSVVNLVVATKSSQVQTVISNKN